MPGGEIYSRVKNEIRLPEDHVKFYAAELICALDHLHSFNIAYRDIKPENLMISLTGHLKVVDFGFAKIVNDRTYSVCGTPEFLSPEVIIREGHDKRVDWWSFGVLLWELVMGIPAFHADSPMKIYEKIMNHTRFFFPPTRVCQELRDVINGCVVKDPASRLNAS